MQMAQSMGMLGGSTGDDDALESFLDSYLTNGFGTSGNSGFGMGMQQQPQQAAPQLLGGGLAGQPQMHASILRPASVGQPPMSGPIQGLNGMGFSSTDDTSNMSIPALQALIRQRQLQQQQASFGGVTAAPFGQMSVMGGAGVGNPGLMRPTSLQDHLSGAVSSDHSVWRPNLGTLPSASGMQSFSANHGTHFGGGDQLAGFHEATFPNLLGPTPTLRPASDSLLANQKAATSTPINLQGHGQSSLRTNSLSAQTAATGAGAAGGGGFGGGILGGGSKKAIWDATTTPVAEGSDDSSEDDSSQRRRVKGRSASTNHQPSVQQEKNRSAQRRFRQRQKEKMAYLENRTEVLSVQVEKLTQENDSLRNMNTMLEKVLNLREEHISNLQEAAKVFSNLNIRGDAECSGAEENAVGTDAVKTMEDVVAAAAAGGPATARGGGLVIKTEEAPSSGSGGMADIPMTASSPMGLLTAGGGHVLPQNMDGATARFTAEAIRSMSSDDVIEAWKENLKELSRYVVLAENAPPGQQLPSHVLSRITAVTASMSELVHKVAMISPLNVKRLLATNMELHAMVPVPETHWARVLLVLGLSERQRKDLLGARERFLLKFEALVQERTALVNSLSQQAIPRSRVYADICSASLAAHEAADRLRANLQREHNINMEFVVFVFRGVLDLMQIAKAAVHSYPYYPDVLAMSNVLYAQQPQSQQQQQQHSSLSQSPLLSQSSLQPQPPVVQQQQQQLTTKSSHSPSPQLQVLGPGGNLGGLRSTGSVPLGAGMLYETRGMNSISMATTGLTTTAGGGSIGGAATVCGPAACGGSSSIGGNCSGGGGSGNNGMNGLLGLGGGSASGGGGGGIGSATNMASLSLGPMGLGLGAMGLGSLGSLGSTSAPGAGNMMGFPQQQQQQQASMLQQQQQLLQVQSQQEDSRMMDA